MKVSRSYARSLYRWRRQAARLIVDACWLMSPTEQAYAAMCRAVESGRPFNVATVRAHCEALLLDADALDDERVVFMDWTRARGMGPEVHDRGAFMRSCAGCADRAARGIVSEVSVSYVCTVDITPGVTDCGHEYIGLAKDVRQIGVAAIACTECGGSSMRRGGWPGNLAREYAAEKRSRLLCPRKDCNGGVLAKPLPPLTEDDAGAIMTLVRRGAITASDASDIAVGACPECKRFAAANTSRAFANGGNLRRAAQRLLDTLDGRCPWSGDAEAQPSECTRCNGASPAPRVYNLGGRTVRHGDRMPPSYVPPLRYRYLFERRGDVWQVVDNVTVCNGCNGTGHNLRGVLPTLAPELVDHRATAGRPWRRPVEHDGGDRVE